MNIEKWQFLPHTCVCSVTSKPFKIFSWNFTQVLSTMRWHAERRYPNSGLHTFGVIALWTWKIAISTTYLCPLCNIKTIWDIFMKLHTNVKHHETKCKTQESQLWIAYFWSYCPLNIEPFEIFLWNVTQMLRRMRWSAGTVTLDSIHSHINVKHHETMCRCAFILESPMSTHSRSTIITWTGLFFGNTITIVIIHAVNHSYNLSFLHKHKNVQFISTHTVWPWPKVKVDWLWCLPLFLRQKF